MQWSSSDSLHPSAYTQDSRWNIVMTRIEKLLNKFKENVEEFGSPKWNKAERKKMLKQLREMEEELDKAYGLNKEVGEE